MAETPDWDELWDKYVDKEVDVDELVKFDSQEQITRWLDDDIQDRLPKARRTFSNGKTVTWDTRPQFIRGMKKTQQYEDLKTAVQTNQTISSAINRANSRNFTESSVRTLSSEIFETISNAENRISYGRARDIIKSEQADKAVIERILGKSIKPGTKLKALEKYTPASRVGESLKSDAVSRLEVQAVRESRGIATGFQSQITRTETPAQVDSIIREAQSELSQGNISQKEFDFLQRLSDIRKEQVLGGNSNQ